jgi:large subunit ribosomal protein L9
MKVILLEDVERVGKQGEVLSVRDGFARNYLLPRKQAIVATREQLKRLDEVRQKLATQLARRNKRLGDRVAKIEQLALKAQLRIGAEGKAFGAITGAEVAELLAEAGFTVDKHDVLLADPIKEPGVHDVPIRIGPGTRASLKLWVAGQEAGTAESPAAGGS